MTISVIIPVYKVEKYVKRCLDSVLKQKCNGFDVECVLVDDCSPDHSMDVVREMITGYEGDTVSFNVIKHEHNRGLSVARNTGILAAKGDFLYFLDSDDLISEEALKLLYAVFLQHPEVDVSMGNTFWEEEGHDINTLSADNVKNVRYFDNKEEIVRTMLRRKINRLSVNKLIRRSFIQDNNLFFDEGLLYEDVIWTYRLFMCISSICIIPDVTYIYKNNPTSIVHTKDARAPQMLKSFIFISDYVLHHPPVMGNNNLYAAHRLFVFHWLIMAVDIKVKHRLNDQGQLNSLSYEMLSDAFRHCRPLMSMFFLTLVSPLKYLTRLKLFRYNIDRIEKFVYKFS